MVTQELKTRYLASLRTLFDIMIEKTGPEETLKTTLETLNRLSTEFQEEIKQRQASIKELDQDITGVSLMIEEFNASGAFDANKLFEYSLPKNSMDRLTNADAADLERRIADAELAVTLFKLVQGKTA